MNGVQFCVNKNSRCPIPVNILTSGVHFSVDTAVIPECNLVLVSRI